MSWKMSASEKSLSVPSSAIFQAFLVEVTNPRIQPARATISQKKTLAVPAVCVGRGSVASVSWSRQDKRPNAKSPKETAATTTRESRHAAEPGSRPFRTSRSRSSSVWRRLTSSSFWSFVSIETPSFLRYTWTHDEHSRALSPGGLHSRQKARPHFWHSDAYPRPCLRERSRKKAAPIARRTAQTSGTPKSADEGLPPKRGRPSPSWSR